MKRSKMVVSIVVISAMAIGLFMTNEALSATGGKEEIREEPIATAGPVSEWKTYRNEEWGYSLEYPSHWKAEVTLKNVGEHPEYVIKEKVSFFSPRYLEIGIDVWTNPSKLDLSRWFEKYGKWAVGEEAETTQCTATALELPAICVREPGSSQAYETLNSLFQKGNYVYRVRYTNSDQGQSMEIYGHILFSFKFE